MIAVTKVKAQFIKVCEEVKINVENVKTITLIFVTKNREYFLILSHFYERETCVYIINIRNETCKIKMINDNKIKINFNAMLFKHTFNREVLKIFFKIFNVFLNV